MERVHDENHLRSIIDSVEDFAIFTTDERGIIQLWSAGAHRVFGWSAEEVRGQHGRVIFTPEDRDRGAPEAEMRTAEERGRAIDERWHIRKDGSRFFASGVLTVLRPVGRSRGFVKVARDLTERKVFEDALKQAHDSLEERVRQRTSELAERNDALAAQVRAREAAEAEIKSLFSRLVSIQEAERSRIARDLHDGLGQLMTALRMTLEALITTPPEAESFATLLGRGHKLVHELDQALDFLTWELRPGGSDRVSLTAALAALLESWSQRFDIAAEFVTNADYQLPPDVQGNVYRLVQEALHNVAKHAAAGHVTVMLERRGVELVILIEDDGRGFSQDIPPDDSVKGGMGLTSMRERAVLAGGSLTIESTPGQGTSIYVRVPVASSSEPVEFD